MIMCDDKQNNTLHCPDEGTVLEVHSAIISQEEKQLEECFYVGITKFQNPCNFPDQTKETKIKCDGNRTCSLEGALNVDICSRLKKFFDVTYSCRVNRTTTEGKQFFSQLQMYHCTPKRIITISYN